MDILNVKALIYDDKLVGLRFITTEGIFDADKESLQEEGVVNINIPNRVELILADDHLLSYDEIENGLVTIDISTNKAILVHLVDSLRHSGFDDVLFQTQQPWEQSLTIFLDDEGWQAVKVDRTDEYANQHYMITPDGTRWRGGWIGSFNSPEQAKRAFHYNQTVLAFHRGDKVAYEALSTYPELKRYMELVEHIKQKVKVDNELISIDVGFEVKEIPIDAYPTQTRIEQRSFISANQLIPLDAQDIELPSTLFDIRELTAIAIAIRLREHDIRTTGNPYYINQ